MQLNRLQDLPSRRKKTGRPALRTATLSCQGKALDTGAATFVLHDFLARSPPSFLKDGNSALGRLNAKNQIDAQS
jgi:hypothetical protein